MFATTGTPRAAARFAYHEVTVQDVGVERRLGRVGDVEVVEHRPLVGDRLADPAGDVGFELQVVADPHRGLIGSRHVEPRHLHERGDVRLDVVFPDALLAERLAVVCGDDDVAVEVVDEVGYRLECDPEVLLV